MATKSEFELVNDFLDATYTFFDCANEIIERNILTDAELGILVKVMFEVFCEGEERENGEIL